MWVLFWKKYSLSKFATFLSVLGALMRYAGVMCLFENSIPAALLCIAFGIALHFVAEAIAKNKATKVVGKINATKATTAQTASKASQTKPTPSVTAQPDFTSDGKIKCSKCGAYASNTYKFCTECGNVIITEVSKKKKCLRCGELAENGSKFCTNCGYEIK